MKHLSFLLVLFSFFLFFSCGDDPPKRITKVVSFPVVKKSLSPRLALSLMVLETTHEQLFDRVFGDSTFVLKVYSDEGVIVSKTSTLVKEVFRLNDGSEKKFHSLLMPRSFHKIPKKRFLITVNDSIRMICGHNGLISVEGIPVSTVPYVKHKFHLPFAADIFYVYDYIHEIRVGELPMYLAGKTLYFKGVASKATSSLPQAPPSLDFIWDSWHIERLPDSLCLLVGGQYFSNEMFIREDVSPQPAGKMPPRRFGERSKSYHPVIPPPSENLGDGL